MNLIAETDGVDKGTNNRCGAFRLNDDSEQFMRATRAATKGKYSLVSPLELDIIFELFDEDGLLFLFSCYDY